MRPLLAKTKRKIDRELRAIYADRDGSMPDLSRIDRRKSSRFTRFLVRTLGVLVLLSAASWAGFVVWSRGWLQSNTDPLVASIEGPREAKGGEEVYYTIRYANHGHVPLARLGLKLQVPVGFHIRSLTPAPTDTNDRSWTLGSLNPDSDGSVAIAGTFRSESVTPEGNPGAAQLLQAYFTYKPANFNADFQDIQTASVSPKGSVLALTVLGPEKVIAGEAADYTLNVQNTGTIPVERVRVTALLPPGYVFADASPKPTTTGQAQWDIALLAPGELKTIAVKGRFTASIADEQVFKADISFLEGSAPARQGLAETKTTVLKSAITLGLLVNGVAGAQTANTGDVLHLSVNYGNGESKTMEDLALTLSAVAPSGKALPVDWDKADIGKAVRDGNTLRWDAKADTALAKLGVKAAGTYAFILPLLSSIDLSKTADRAIFTLSATCTKVGGVAKTRTVETSPLTVSLNTEFAVASEARYYNADGATIGRGPLPPKVGKTTGYRIAWNVQNVLHDARGFSMSTVLPANTTWADSSDANVGSVTFDEGTRTVTWQAASLPRSSAVSSARFDVSITPQLADVGSLLPLTGAVIATATDTVTNHDLSRSLPALDTKLMNDPGAKDKGVVVK